MAWQNQYRPRKIEDLHLNSVRERMQSFMRSGKLPRVLLFAGPKGTGKTSTARILAAILNSNINQAAILANFSAISNDKQNLSFSEADQDDIQVQKIFSGASFLVQEIDAASNSGVDDVRRLQEQIFMPPSMSQISVYIFDEVHMLSNAAFNALLKTLEEPPAHCIFILATTELHKIPATIVSRCNLINFTKATESELITSFQKVLTAEQITYEAGALELLAKSADGSFRDGIKILESAANLSAAAGTKQITLADALAVLQGDFSQSAAELLKYMVNDKNSAAICTFFDNLRDQGVDEVNFYKVWLNFLYEQLQISLIPDNPKFQGKKALVNSKISHYLLQETGSFKANERQLLPFLNLELKCLEIVIKSNSKAAPEPKKPISSSSPSNTVVSPSKPIISAQKVSSPSSQIEIKKTTLQTAKTIELSTNLPQNSQSINPAIGQNPTDITANWRKFVQQITAKNSYLASIFKLSEPAGETATVFKIGISSNFFKDKAQEPKNSALIKKVIAEMGFPPKKIEFVLLEKAAPAQAVSASKPVSTINTYQKLNQASNEIESIPEVKSVLEALT